MPLRFFRKEDSAVSKREREERVEKQVVQSFRTMADALKKMADFIESRRLQRNGYETRERFLERTEPPKDKR